MTAAGSHARDDIRIRRAGPGDLDAIAPLFDAYRVFYRQPSDLPRAHAFMRDRLERGDSAVFIALAGPDPSPTPAGFTQLYPSFTSVGAARTWILNDLFVEPTFRKRSVADRLMDEAERFAAADGARSISLLTAQDNAAARHLYERRRWALDEQFVRYIKRFG